MSKKNTNLSLDVKLVEKVKVKIVNKITLSALVENLLQEFLERKGK